MVGGGQLARMSAAPAAALGIDLRVLATSRQESAAQVVSDVSLGAHDDEHAVLAFADGCDASRSITSTFPGRFWRSWKLVESPCGRGPVR